MDNNGKFILSEGIGLQKLGLAPGEVVGRSAFDIYKNYPDILNMIKKALNGKITQATHKVDEVIFDVLYTPLRDDQNHMNGVVGVAFDITEKSKADEALSFSEKKFSTAFHISPDMISISRIADSVVLEVNESVNDLIGYAPKEVIGKSTLELGIWPFPEERLHLAEILQKHGVFKNTEIHMRKKDGTIITVLATGSIFKMQDEDCVLASLRDISDRKKAEETLRESEERYRSLVNISPDAISLVDMNRRFLMINPQTVRLHGYKNAAEMYNLDSLDLIAPEDHEKARINAENILKNGSSTSIEMHVLRKDGSRVPVEVNATLLKNDDDQPVAFISIVRDISLRKKLEAEAFRSDKLESVGVLAGGIAHDFNNLLTAILGNISFAQMNVSPSDKIYKFLENAEEASCRARDLTQQLLTFSKGGMPIKQLIAVSDLLKSACKFALSGSKVKSEFSFAKTLFDIEADEGQLNQVFNNITLNAVQAMPNGGLISISAANFLQKADSTLPIKPGKYVKIKISDQGIGIPKEHLSQIFDPYFTTKDMGNGLGLTTVYSIITKHDGYIMADSELGRGTSFYIYLPASELKSEKIQKQDMIESRSTGRILVMDDEEIIRDLLRDILSNLGYEVSCVEDGHELITVYKQALEHKTPFDIVIMDLTIPGGMGGIETIKELHKIDTQVKSIVSSGYANDPVMSNFRDYGFNDVITKPYQMQELGDVIRRVLNGNQ